MLPPIYVSGILLLYMSSFFLVNAHNIFKGIQERGGTKTYAEAERPGGPYLILVSVGTFVFFAEALMLILLGFTGDTYVFLSSLGLDTKHATLLQLIGIFSMGAGVFLFIWSVVSRGRSAVSWEMPEDHALVTWGPYRYVRHPSYLGYFLMFVGLPLTWLNLIAMIPLVAIPGYMSIVEIEEEMLIHRFGEAYRKYKYDTGRFLPRIIKRNTVT